MVIKIWSVTITPQSAIRWSLFSCYCGSPTLLADALTPDLGIALMLCCIDPYAYPNRLADLPHLTTSISSLKLPSCQVTEDLRFKLLLLVDKWHTSNKSRGAFFGLKDFFSSQASRNSNGKVTQKSHLHRNRALWSVPRWGRQRCPRLHNAHQGLTSEGWKGEQKTMNDLLGNEVVKHDLICVYICHYVYYIIQ